ncbi:CrcB protein [Caldicoprobacter guelmensis]|uniref:fluoride efflux transporter FluC n=1 Tax=Caldicoprobacter guelmensis TaxID=1170224 RepID=UPI001959A62C|nr:CrcB family protein [Caldicoprobacter guelmensis]MBM7581760.1 CrcB protein [Caldicoprobacter guelmensis]
MKKYIFIGIGGSVGAVLRVAIKAVQIGVYKNIPINTLSINVVGSFMLAFILTVVLEFCEVDEHVHLGITTGFLGAFTTFSTLCKEAVELVRRGFYNIALFYIVISAALGFSAAYFGVYLAGRIKTVMIKRHGADIFEEDK